MYVASAVSWPHVADRLPVRWGLSGQANRYGGRFEGLVLVPLVATFVYLINLVPASASQPAMIFIRLAIVIPMGANYAAILLIYRGYRVNLTNCVFFALATMLAAMVAVVYFQSRKTAHP